MPYGSLYNVLHEGTSECGHGEGLAAVGGRRSHPRSSPQHRHRPSPPADFVVDQMQAVKFALDIARGMAFLHTLEPLIPRHHLNSRSVMVSALQAHPAPICSCVSPR